MKIEIVDAREHHPDCYREVFEGYKALQLIDDNDQERGELVWRVATGYTVEITEFGIYDPADRRQGWGTQLLEAGIVSIREFFSLTRHKLRRIYLFCESINEAGRAFYEARGFKAKAILKGFYQDCDAILYIRDFDESLTDGV